MVATACRWLVELGTRLTVIEKTEFAPGVLDVKEPASLLMVTLAAETFTLTTCVVADVCETTGETVMLTAVGRAHWLGVRVNVGGRTVLVRVGDRVGVNANT